MRLKDKVAIVVGAGQSPGGAQSPGGPMAATRMCRSAHGNCEARKVSR